MICSICNDNSLPLSGTPGYKTICIACEVNDFEEKTRQKYLLELSEFECRTGKNLCIGEFFYQCVAGRIPKTLLKGLLYLLETFDQAMEYNRDCFPQLSIKYK